MLLQATLFVLYMGLFICMGQLVSSSKLPDGTLPVRSFAVSSSHWGGMEWILSRRRPAGCYTSHVVVGVPLPRTHTTQHTHTHTACPPPRSSILTHHPPIPPPTVQPCRARLLHRRGQARHRCGAVSRPVGVLRARPVRPAANAREARGALLHPRRGIWYGVCLRVLLPVSRTGSLSPPSHASRASCASPTLHTRRRVRLAL